MHGPLWFPGENAGNHGVQEKKKLRKQRREEREKEKQQNIQLGLLEPPKDKVRLSNMARVYGAAGVVDATAIEMKVRAAQEERQRAHEDRNAARKLTASERKEKKMKKLFDNDAADIIVQVRSVHTRLQAHHVSPLSGNTCTDFHEKESQPLSDTHRRSSIARTQCVLVLGWVA